MSFRTVPVALGTLLLAAPLMAQAQGPLDRVSLGATTTLTSDYLFRGVSQTSGDPAIQGSFDLSLDTGTVADIYAGVWASNVEFRPGGGDPASIEIDYYGGLNGTMPRFERLSWDLGFVYYTYPDQDEEDGAFPGGDAEFNYVEATANLGYDAPAVGAGLMEVDPSFGVGYAFTPDFFGDDDTGHYFSGSMDLGMPYGFGLGFLVGYQDVDGDELTNGFNYGHYRIALSKQIREFTVSVSWNDGFDNNGDVNPNLLEDQVEATLSASF